MRKLLVTCCIVGASVLCQTNVGSQQAKTLTESSYARAREALQRGIAAMGGLDNFQGAEDIRYKSTAKVPEIGQSANPEAAYYQRPLETEGVFDLAHKRYYQLRKTRYLGSGARWSSVVTTPASGFTVDLRANAVYPLAPQGVANNNKAVQRAFPYLILQTALSRASTLRWLGDGDYDGRKQGVVGFADADGNLVTLYFDTQTGLLTKTEGLSDAFLEGLTTTETIYSDYRPVNGIRMPFHVVGRLGGVVVSDAVYSEIAINTHPDTAVFTTPASAVVGPEVGGRPQPITLTALGKDVYYVNPIESGGIFFYSSLFVVFHDYVLVIEAPLSGNVSAAVIAKIKETAPGKPIRYLVMTHYHTDHSGGVRGYIAEGSTIVTTPGNEKFIKDLAAIEHPLNPDQLSLHPRTPSVETFDRKRVFSDGDHVVELYNVGPTPHVDEMVMAYLPREKLAFVSDLFLVSLKGNIGPAEPLTVLFNQRIHELGLQIETIAGGHGRIGTMAELQRSLAEKPEAPNGQ